MGLPAWIAASIRAEPPEVKPVADAFVIPVWHSGVNAAPRYAALFRSLLKVFSSGEWIWPQRWYEQKRNHIASMIRSRYVPQMVRSVKGARVRPFPTSIFN
jgi:hypothetical protein